MNKILLFLSILSLCITSCDENPVVTDIIETIDPNEGQLVCSTKLDKITDVVWVEYKYTIDTLHFGGKKTTLTQPSVGSIIFKNDSNYLKQSTGIIERGKWLFDDNNCLFILTETNKNAFRGFEVIQKNDTLLLSTRINNLIYTNHFVKKANELENPEFPIIIEPEYKCKDTLLIKKWYNTKTRIDNLGLNGSIIGSYYIYPLAYFNLVHNKEYFVRALNNSYGHNGNWELNGNCDLTLDKHTNAERMFKILKVTKDSLILKSYLTHEIYTQYYSR